MRAATLEEAVETALLTPYALTGGFYSRSPSHIEYARRRFQVGNLYINRGITGAMVGRQPFGGFGMSGVGSKAGGPDYLRQFLEPRTITENLLRRGFAYRRGAAKERRPALSPAGPLAPSGRPGLSIVGLEHRFFVRLRADSE